MVIGLLLFCLCATHVYAADALKKSTDSVSLHVVSSSSEDEGAAHGQQLHLDLNQLSSLQEQDMYAFNQQLSARVMQKLSDSGAAEVNQQFIEVALGQMLQRSASYRTALCSYGIKKDKEVDGDVTTELLTRYISLQQAQYREQKEADDVHRAQARKRERCGFAIGTIGACAGVAGTVLGIIGMLSC